MGVHYSEEEIERVINALRESARGNLEGKSDPAARMRIMEAVGVPLLRADFEECNRGTSPGIVAETAVDILSWWLAHIVGNSQAASPVEQTELVVKLCSRIGRGAMERIVGSEVTRARAEQAGHS